jgi:hypothetical protein
MSKPDCNDIDHVAMLFLISDDELERAGGGYDEQVPTLVGTYCLTCPAEMEIAI